MIYMQSEQAYAISH